MNNVGSGQQEESEYDEEAVEVLEQQERDLNTISRQELADKISRMKDKIRRVQ